MTTTQTPRHTLLDSVPTGLYIGGQWRASDSGNTFPVHDPATGRELATVADATITDGAAALDAAATAQKSWARTAPRDRAELLRAAFDAVVARTDDFALLMTLEMGKPLAEARGEVAYGAEFLRWFSEESVRVSGRYSTAPDGKTRLLVHKRPVGPCLFITPWNFPLAMATRKIAPAIAAGCTMVVKPATLTPLTTLLFAQVLEEVGLPTGVLNVIPTSRAGAVTGPLITDPRLRKLSFTGSTEIGRRLLANSAQQMLRTSMELGGNAPFLVFADADIDAAVEGAVVAKMRNMGEACTAANRFIVHESVADEFATKLAGRMKWADRRSRDRAGLAGRPADRPGLPRQGSQPGSRCSAGWSGDHHRGPAGARRRLLLSPDCVDRGHRRRPNPSRGGFRSGGSDHDLPG